MAWDRAGPRGLQGAASVRRSRVEAPSLELARSAGESLRQTKSLSSQLGALRREGMEGPAQGHAAPRARPEGRGRARWLALRAVQGEADLASQTNNVCECHRSLFSPGTVTISVPFYPVTFRTAL